MTTATIGGVGTAEITMTDQPMTVRQIIENGLTQFGRSPAAAEKFSYIVGGKTAKAEDVVLPGTETRVVAAPRLNNG